MTTLFALFDLISERTREASRKPGHPGRSWGDRNRWVSRASTAGKTRFAGSVEELHREDHGVTRPTLYNFI